MTVPYLNSFAKLLLRWRGSVWKAVWKDLTVFLIIYYIINLVYRLALNYHQQAIFRGIVGYCDRASGYIPLTFLLGFFVSAIVARWWEQFNCIPWPDKFMTLVTTHIKGDEYLVLRRTLARWVNLSSALCWRSISLRTLKRFPTIQHFVGAGLMNEEELKVYNAMETDHGKWWLPILWTCNLLNKCKEENAIDSVLLKNLIKEAMAFRFYLVMLLIYDWVSVPLVYTQVVAIATYGYFAICVVGRQIVEEPDIYVPIFTILQFIFFVGWLKVGEDLMHPFGEDDDDFDMNYILDRNLQISYLLADQAHRQLPPLEKDVYWGQKNPRLPHTKASLKRRDILFDGHLANVKVPEKDMELIHPSHPLYSVEGEEEAILKWFKALIHALRRNAQANGESVPNTINIRITTGPPSSTVDTVPKTNDDRVRL